MIRPATAFRFRDRIFSGKEGSSLKTLFQVLGKWKDGKFGFDVHSQTATLTRFSYSFVTRSYYTAVYIPPKIEQVCS